MIVINAGMEKSGSAYFFNLVNDLLIAAGRDDVRKIKHKYHLESILELKNCNIRELTREKLELLLSLYEAGKSFAVKTHFPPTDFLKELVTKNIIKVIYTHRDPRDVILSAIDHGELQRRQGQNEEYFAQFETIESSIPLVRQWLKTWEEWVGFEKVLFVKYESLITDTLNELKRVCNYLDIEVKPKKIGKVISKYSKQNLKKGKLPPIHFNKGIIGRYKKEMSGAEIALCNRHMGSYIIKMGYRLD